VILWRISEFFELDGAGGVVMNGRWHTKGHPIIYTAESSALTLLETLVHLEWEHTPSSYQLLRIEARDDLEIENHPSSVAPSKIEESMAWGDRWLASGRTALASVPAAVAPLSRNILINPVHPDAAAIRVADHSRWPWDKRLFKPAP
jgi:RES domain-containing protein